MLRRDKEPRRRDQSQDENSQKVSFRDTRRPEAEHGLTLYLCVEIFERSTAYPISKHGIQKGVRSIVKVECGEPTDESASTSIEHFTGMITTLNEDGKAVKDPLEMQNILLRGCVLRNTNWVYGLVVHTGNDTKIQMANVNSGQMKLSAIDKEINLVLK